MSGAVTESRVETTTIARCWAVTRMDGMVLGFTDHDRGFSFDGIAFKADTGMTARALQQSTGLSVDNSQAMGALSDAAIREADILAGRYDGAEVTAWLVNWADPSQFLLEHVREIGEVTRTDNSFRAELRGMAQRG